MSGARVDGRTARWTGHREQRREAFVEAALVVIDRVGPAATVDQIGQELGGTRQAVYRQFADRRDLDAAIAARAADMLVDDLVPRLERGTGLDDLEGSIAALLHAYLDFVQRHLHLYRFVRAHELEVGAGSAVRHVKDTLGGRITALARDLLTDVELPEQTAQTFAIAMIGLVDAVVGRWIDEPRGLDADQLMEQLGQLVTGAASAVLSQR